MSPINKPTPSSLQAGCPSCSPTNSVKSTTDQTNSISAAVVAP